MACNIEELVYETVEKVEETVSVYEAAELMAGRNLGSVVVTRNGQVVGVFTERDMINRVVGVRKDPGETTLGDVCSRNLISINADSSCQHAIKVMSANKCRRLIVYKNDNFQGLVSLPKVAHAMATGGSRDLAVNFVFAVSLTVILGFIVLLASRLPDVINLAEKTM